VVCERHFHKEEILRKRIMTDKNGAILAEVCLLYLLGINRYLPIGFLIFTYKHNLIKTNKNLIALSKNMKCIAIVFPCYSKTPNMFISL